MTNLDIVYVLSIIIIIIIIITDKRKPNAYVYLSRTNSASILLTNRSWAIIISLNVVPRDIYNLFCSRCKLISHHIYWTWSLYMCVCVYIYVNICNRNLAKEYMNLIITFLLYFSKGIDQTEGDRGIVQF